MSIAYHYTDAPGLLGIISTLNLRATNINFLNDYAEFQSGLDNLQEFCKLQLNDKKIISAAKKLYKNLFPIIQKNLIERHIFVTSFTTKKDNLRQWMAYGSPNSSYAIGFDTSILENLTLQIENTNEPNDNVFSHCKYQFRKVTYDGYSNIEKSISKEAIISNSILGDDALAKYVHWFMNELFFECCSIKNNEFIDESELRLIFQSNKMNTTLKHQKFRARNGILIPYIEIPYPATSIKEIIIGPTIDKELSENGLTTMLKHYNINCEVSHTNCTLRQF